VCEEQENWISTFLIELFLIHHGTTTGKIAIQQYDAEGRTAYFLAMAVTIFLFNFDLLPLHKTVFEACSLLNSTMFCCV
jgi:hypothetical protein